MAEMVGSAVVQEAVSRVSSFIFNRRDDKVPEDLIIERLDIALSELELALERSAKLPITDVALLYRRRLFKWVYIEGVHLLSRHRKLAAAPKSQDKGQAGVTHFSFPERIIWPKLFSISSLIGLNKDEHLSFSDVRRFEYFADHAGKFVGDVESGCSLRHHTFCSPLVRQLLAGKTLGYEMVQGNRRRECYIWPICFEDRGVEALLSYDYKDHDAPKSFNLQLILRLSESTDISRIATRCLHSLASLFKLVTETALGELTLLHNLQDISGISCASFDNPDVYAQLTQSCRRDPLCCRANGKQTDSDKITSLAVSHKFPGLIMVVFECYVSAQVYSLHSSTNDWCTDAARARDWPPLLEMTTCLLPHVFPEDQQDMYAMEVMGSREERRDGSIQQMAETVISKAISSFVCQSELTDYRMTLISGHAAAYFSLRKSTTETARMPELNSRSRTKRVAKRRR